MMTRYYVDQINKELSPRNCIEVFLADDAAAQERMLDAWNAHACPGEMEQQVAELRRESEAMRVALNKAEAERDALRQRLAEVVAVIPTTWLDPLLTGPDAVIGQPPYNCQDIEQLLKEVAAKLEAALVKAEEE